MGSPVHLFIYLFRVRPARYGPAYGRWNKPVTNNDNMESYIFNWLKPLAATVKDHHNLRTFEYVNEAPEIEWRYRRSGKAVIF